MEKINLNDLLRFTKRTHILFALLVGPFIAIATITGALYTLAFSIENFQYRNLLTHSSTGTHISLDQQVQLAKSSLGEDFKFQSVRLQLNPKSTTQVLFKHNSLKSSEYYTLFVLPIIFELIRPLISKKV